VDQSRKAHESKLRGVSQVRERSGHDTLTLKTEVGEESHVFGSLFGFGQFGKDQEASVALALSKPDTLESRSQTIQEGFGDTATVHDPSGANMFET
jgi:hypothetical protein